MDYFETLANSTATWLPKIGIFILILVIGWIVSIILKWIVTNALRGLGLDRRLDRSPAHNIVRKLAVSPSEWIGKLVYWVGIIVTFSIAIAAMNVPAFNAFLAGIYGYVPNILGAILILAVAMALATAASSVTIKLMGDTPTGKIVSTVVPTVILSIAGFAILEQLRIAPSIVTITYAVILGSIGLGFALAFGLGARNTADKMVAQAYESGRKNMGQVKQDIQKAKERGEREVKEQKRKFDEKNR